MSPKFTRPRTSASGSEAIAFLLSDAASGVTGALLPVTGRG
jgi:NAD(P)-dependent dehydrogenase (short-subunit alcohol dehydrogenase family)